MCGRPDSRMQVRNSSELVPPPAPSQNYFDHRLLISSGDATAGFRRHRLGASYDAARGTAAVFPTHFGHQPLHQGLGALRSQILGGFQSFFAPTQSASVLLSRS